MPDETPHQRLPDMRSELERFNEFRKHYLQNQPIDREKGMQLPRSGVGGDVE